MEVKVTKKPERIKDFFFFASPWLTGFFLLTIVPLASSLALSLTKWDILTPPEFIGLTNYIEIFQDPLFFKSLKVTISFAIISVPLSVLLE
jgi:multiple sugar transport system permease protein